MNSSDLRNFRKKIDIQNNLIPFLTLSGWVLDDINNKNWFILHGENDNQNKPLELVLPKNKSDETLLENYINKAIELLSAVKNEQSQIIIQSILYYDRDQIFIKNSDQLDSDAIELPLAFNQIKNLKRTIEFSGTAEHDAKPYFRYASPYSREITKKFLFGHTFRGSFGFTIHAPRLSLPNKFIQTRLNFEENLPAIIKSDIPFERRIVERIARGLNYTKVAEEKQDYEVLLHDFASGFNSNMCSSIIGISNERRSSVEYKIVWSPKIKQGSDLDENINVRIHENGYEILEYVAKQLKIRKPEMIVLSGNIRALTASDNPFNQQTHRAVILRGQIPDSKRATDIILDLEREDYNKAINAHKNWQIVRVSGVLSRSGSGWRLLNIKDFSVLE